MKKLVGGAIAVTLGVLFLSLFFKDFLNFLAGSIPVLLIITGALVLYINYEGRDSGDQPEEEGWKDDDVFHQPAEPAAVEPDAAEKVEPEPTPEEAVPEEPALEKSVPEAVKAGEPAKEAPEPEEAAPKEAAAEEPVKKEPEPPKEQKETKPAEPAEEEIKKEPEEKKDEPAAQSASSDKTGKLIGNTGTLVFHTQDCRYSKSKQCTAFFDSKEEAEKQGYKPCGTCNP